MKYQFYVIGRRRGRGDYDLRQFYMPVRQVEGLWVPAGKPVEEHTHKCQIALNLYESQICTDNTAGSLDDLPCPDGWKVLARDWLPDDYQPETPEEDAQKTAEAIEHLRKMGVWRDPS